MPPELLLGGLPQRQVSLVYQPRCKGGSDRPRGRPRRRHRRQRLQHSAFIDLLAFFSFTRLLASLAPRTAIISPRTRSGPRPRLRVAPARPGTVAASTGILGTTVAAPRERERPWPRPPVTKVIDS